MATFTVRGHKLRSASTRRFLVVRIKSDAWAVMNIQTSSWGHDFHQVAFDGRGFRMVFATEAEAIEACGDDQVVKVWSTAGATVEKRSDSVTTARAHASRIGGCVVIDTATGEEI